ncbi:hypothetical protein SAMN02799630_05391 [Paenibacillus sp. UNCCL117]|uniref:hypothetical protein n=1 Tax=unclassified Paenibacillus TaxID=185978 RepID=UPI00088E3227|nr:MULTISPECIES: hypothetical protein [unclassified Paenibacillus]SDE41466.1 hypothetical protein SAMN04488602_12760 [Paenibacillus sp. cl123]SFW65488.1 hypothetical protein SAMN02799630_05391 [Paenibacillus sp. UNCCL117]
MKRILSISTVTSHLWVQWILLGSMLLNTFMVYPNIFHDIPNSLNTAMEFMKVASPHTYFPPLGFMSWVTGVAAILFSWRYKNARVLIIGSVLMMFAEGAASVIWEWPRNEIMFIEGSAVHATEVLQQAYDEFIIVHWFRLLCNAAGSILIFLGFLRVARLNEVKSERG